MNELTTTLTDVVNSIVIKTISDIKDMIVDIKVNNNNPVLKNIHIVFTNGLTLSIAGTSNGDDSADLRIEVAVLNNDGVLDHTYLNEIADGDDIDVIDRYDILVGYLYRIAYTGMLHRTTPDKYYLDFGMMRNCTITDINIIIDSDSEIVFTLKDGNKFKLYHEQDCCEDVELIEVIGDLSDLLNTPLVECNLICSCESHKEHDDRETWSFYKLRTSKGEVVFRWRGVSNGYYSETVDFTSVN